MFATNDEQVRRWRAKYRPDGAKRWHDSLTEREWEHLQDAARYLADRYGWDVNDAVRFLAVDREPTVLPIRATLMRSHDGAGLPGSYALGSDPADPEAGTWSFPWRNRVELSVDPHVTPAQLAEYWLKLRKRVVVGSHRPQKPRSLKLVAFLAGRANEATGSHRQAWNAEHSDERYAKGLTSSETHATHSRVCANRSRSAGLTNRSSPASFQPPTPPSPPRPPHTSRDLRCLPRSLTRTTRGQDPGSTPPSRTG